MRESEPCHERPLGLEDGRFGGSRELLSPGTPSGRELEIRGVGGQVREDIGRLPDLIRALAEGLEGPKRAGGRNWPDHRNVCRRPRFGPFDISSIGTTTQTLREIFVPLVITGLSKTYPNGVKALDDVSLTIGAGMFGLLGPNGAGKSTLMRTVATLQPPDTGTIRFDDLDVLAQPDELRKVLGYLPQEFGLYPNLSAELTLDHFATMKGVIDGRARKELVGHLLQQTNLYEARKKHVGTFSGGMKQRLGIAIALAGSPQLLIVDEPTAGLDPTERHRFLNLLAEIGQDIVVILSTHIVEDVRELCNAMAIISRGRVVLSGDPQRIVAGLRGKIWRRQVEKGQLDALRASHEVISTSLLAGVPVIHVFADAAPGEGFTAIEPDLEDVYFHQLGLAGQAKAA